LTERTATVAINDAAVDGDRLTASVTVSNLSGHKFPTGFPSRRAWLHVTVLDGSGATIFESGRPEPTGAIAGNDNDADAARFEPHYDLITDPAQVQIYEPIVGDTDGAVTTTLLRGDHYLKDNRVLPAGFDPAEASPSVSPAGEVEHDGSFTGGSDTIIYDIDISGVTGSLTIEVELLYQSIGYRWAANLIEGGGPEIDRFRAALDAVANTPVRIAGDLAAAIP